MHQILVSRQTAFFYCQRATSDNVASLGANYCAHDRRSRSVALPSNMPYQIYLRHVILPAGDAAVLFIYTQRRQKRPTMFLLYSFINFNRHCFFLSLLSVVMGHAMFLPSGVTGCVTLMNLFLAILY